MKTVRVNPRDGEFGAYVEPGSSEGMWEAGIYGRGAGGKVYGMTREMCHFLIDTLVAASGYVFPVRVLVEKVVEHRETYVAPTVKPVGDEEWRGGLKQGDACRVVRDGELVEARFDRWEGRLGLLATVLTAPHGVAFSVELRVGRMFLLRPA